MAELNDKLITYGNLSTFYDKLQEQGLGGNAIEDASVLPDAGENKSKLIRLESDDNVYVSELKSRTSTTTNRLPDAQQIDKAYLYDVEGYTYYYKGAWKFIVSDGEIDGYGWYSVIEDIAYVYVALDDAENTTSDTVFYIASFDEGCIFDLENHTVTNLNYTLAGLENDYKSTFSDSDIIPILAIYNAPESAQIGNAYFELGDIVVYTGIETSITVDGSSVVVYEWEGDGFKLFTSKKAEDIYYYFIESDERLRTDTVIYKKNGNNYQKIDLNDTLIVVFYIPQLNAPDSEQVDNAYIESSDMYAYYKGAIEAHFTDGILTLYRWERTDTYNYFTKYSANQQYNSTIKYGDSEDGLMLYYNSEQSGWYSEDLTVSQAEATMNQVVLPDYIDSYSTVKYQRTEVTEVWDWQPLTDNATNDDIDAMFDTPVPPIVKRTLIRYQDAEQEAEGFIDWLVNTSGETMEFEGQTYYKWVSWANDNSEAPVENDKIMVLTNTLNITLPFNMNSPEYEYTLFNSDLYPDGGVHGTFVKMELQDANGNITYEE